MLIPGIEVPHLCAQCDDAPCVPSCPVKALNVDNATGAIIVDREKCVGCGICMRACPGKIPAMHPTEKYAMICDLCNGDPQCTKPCQKGRHNALWMVDKPANESYRLYSKEPKIATRELARRFFGDKSEELL